MHSTNAMNEGKRYTFKNKLIHKSTFLFLFYLFTNYIYRDKIFYFC